MLIFYKGVCNKLVCRGLFIRHKDLFAFNLLGNTLNKPHDDVIIITPLYAKCGDLLIKYDVSVWYRSRTGDEFETDISVSLLFDGQIFSILKSIHMLWDTQRITTPIKYRTLNIAH
jgi:hypothetical protein